MKKYKQERIACCAWTFDYVDRESSNLKSILPVPITMLPMDFYNEFKSIYFIDLQDQGFLTTHGRFVTPEQARPIAAEAGQADTFRFNNKLSEVDIFNY